ncbi:anchor protein [Opitutaceae bacterium TAV5]|nr:anchor protein [Opitutaceae bacterium TAV5]
MKTKLPAAIAAALACAFAAVQLSAQAIYYTAGHGDLGVSYHPGDTTFGIHWGLDAGATVDGATLTTHTEYAENEVIAWTTATTPLPSSSETWLGVASGPVWRLGSGAYPPDLGFNASGAGDPELWFDTTLAITLTGWNTPEGGEVALRSGASSTASTLFSTYDPASTLDNNTWAFDMSVGHIHLVWYFSVAGTYELTFNWAGTYLGGDTPQEVTGTGTFTFIAGDLPPAIPESATWAAMSGIAVLGLVAWRRRHRS